MNKLFYQDFVEQLMARGTAVMATVLASEQDEIAVGEKAYIIDGQLQKKNIKQQSFWEEVLQVDSFAQLPKTINVQGCSIFIERISKKQTMVICGGGHISLPLAQLGKMLDFEIIVIDDREEFANAERFAMADRVICAPFKEGIEQCLATEDTYFVIVTRGHAHDRFCLEQILQNPFGYVGMIGSRSKVSIVMNYLLEQGYTQDVLDKVYTPIGLSIGAQTPQEIAVSICAQVIEVKNSKGNLTYLEDSVMEQFMNCEEPMAMATIIDKRGSSPRSIGAKMIVRQDGSIFGSVGGGSAEYEIQQKALGVIETKVPLVITSAMTNTSAEANGMICGGTISVIIESIEG